MTLKGLKNIIVDFFQKHQQVNHVSYGDLYEYIAIPDKKYTSVNIEFGGSSISGKFISHNFTISISDLMSLEYPDTEHDAVSDGLEIGKDFLAYINTFDTIFPSNSSIQSFREDKPDITAGIVISLYIQVPLGLNECSIPFVNGSTTTTSTTLEPTTSTSTSTSTTLAPTTSTSTSSTSTTSTTLEPTTSTSTSTTSTTTSSSTTSTTTTEAPTTTSTSTTSTSTTIAPTTTSTTSTSTSTTSSTTSTSSTSSTTTTTTTLAPTTSTTTSTSSTTSTTSSTTTTSSTSSTTSTTTTIEPTTTSTSSTTTSSTTLAPTTSTTTSSSTSTTSTSSSTSTTTTSTTSTSSTTTTTTTVAPLAARFNFNASPQNIAGWKDISGSPHNGVITATDNINGTGITVSSITGKWAAFGDTSNNSFGGTGTSADFPSNVLMSYWFNYSNVYGANGADIKVSNLVPNTLYQLKTIGSRSSTAGSGIPSGQSRLMNFYVSQAATVGDISEQSAIDYAARDSVTTQTFTIASNVSGEIYLGVYASNTGNGTNGDQYGYINGLIINKV